jgi:3-hydroxyisobutyrate dehydrogenase-like beta-hydroxyacid dehydrogenase
MKVGFIGLGRMGSGMAANILKAGHETTVFNRTRSRADELVAGGARAAETIADACRGHAVITMLANDEAVESVVYDEQGVLASLPQGAVHISSSTISAALAERLAASHTAAGQRFISAPVSGRPDAAAAGQLFVIAGGAEEVIRDMSPLLDAIGQKTFVMSDTPSRANLVKLSVNFLIASVIESLGEALALIGKGGVDPGRYIELLTSTLFAAPVYKTYGGLIVGEKFEPAAFAAPLGYKDIKLTLEAADELRVPLPLANLLRDRFLTLLAADGGTLDWSAIGRLPARDSGLPA